MNESTCVVKLSTSAWQDKRGIHVKRSLTIVRRKSGTFPILEQDASDSGVAETVGRIINLDDAEDGLYVVSTCNEHRDWEGGFIDDYDYRLDPIGSKGVTDGD